MNRALNTNVLLIALAAASLFFLGESAKAAIYWANSSTIGRVNLDGTYRLDGGGPGLLYIGYNGSSGIANACGIAVNGSHIFWGDSAHNTIGRANLDGSSPNYAFITGATEPCGVAVNGSHLFWANMGGASIGRASLDGADVNQSFIVGLDKPCGVAVDSSHIFWASEGAIGQANLDGASATKDFVKAAEGACGVAVSGTHVYWGSFGQAIGRADLAGMDPQPEFISGLERPCGLAADETHLYWIEQGFQSRQIGRANLDGTSVSRGIATELRASCGIAVDSLSFVPPPPPGPLTSPCDFGSLRRNSGKGSVAVSLTGPTQGSIRVLTKGLRWRVLSQEPPPFVGGRWLWWVKVWPGAEGQVAQGIRRRLSKTGRAMINLRIRCHGNGELPNTMVKRLALHRVKRDQMKKQPSKGGSRMRLSS